MSQYEYVVAKNTYIVYGDPANVQNTFINIISQSQTIIDHWNPKTMHIGIGNYFHDGASNIDMFKLEITFINTDPIELNIDFIQETYGVTVVQSGESFVSKNLKTSSDDIRDLTFADIFNKFFGNEEYPMLGEAKPKIVGYSLRYNGLYRAFDSIYSLKKFISESFPTIINLATNNFEETKDYLCTYGIIIDEIYEE